MKQLSVQSTFSLSIAVLFNSFTYVLFLVVVCSLYWLLSDRWRQLFLLVSGCLFYGAWRPEGVILLVTFVVANWWFGVWLQQNRRRSVLALGIAFNLLTLGYFKYTNFLLGSLAGPLQLSFPALDIILPLGISFFVFEAISFLCDVYKGNSSVKNFNSFALYISFFPHLIAGPIVRIQQFIPQTLQPKHFNAEQFFSGIDLLCIGALKKVALADNIAPLVDASFRVSHASALDIWITGGLFSLQVYFDFAGYTDMARGAARLFGYELPINFDFPYLSRSIGEFWRRWHITLSNWLRDYLYIPLGGSRAGQVRTCVNLVVTMTLGGIWHGAGWTYLLWGVYQGVALVIHRLCSRPVALKAFFEGTLFGRASAWAITYAAILIGWILFRAQNVEQVAAWFGTLLTPQAYLIAPEYGVWGWFVALCLAAMFVLHRFQEQVAAQWLQLRPLYYPATLMVLTVLAPQSAQFIYFQF